MADTRAEGHLADRLARIARETRCRLTHYGRKSGQPHEVTIWFLVDGEVVYLVTGDRRRHWVRNVLAHPTVQLRVRGETFSGDATRVTEPSELAHVVRLLKRKYWLARPYLWWKGAPDAAFRVRLDGSI
jgi:deazaflavin-dependent oxidoreductase (nitroreductase family)